jgi:hypothetical protein
MPNMHHLLRALAQIPSRVVPKETSFHKEPYAEDPFVA